MSTRSLPSPAVSWLRPKYVAFAFVFFMMAYVINHNERFLINAADPAWTHYQPFRWWLLPHGLAGACALILGPMQFSETLRRRYIKLHRFVGWVYVSGALLAAPLGVFIQYRFDERAGDSRGFTIATVVDALLWMTTTGIALFFVLRGKVNLHRQWMTRSYAVALVFLEVRVISGITGWDSHAATEAIVWTCVGLSLLVGDIAVHWQDLRAPRPAPKTAAPRAQEA